MGESRVPKAAVAVLALVSGGTAANAGTTVLNVPLSELLTSGTTYNGSFDISGLLSDGTTNYEVTGATLQLSGYSEFGQTGTAFAGYYTYSYTAYYVAYYSYSCGSWWSGYYTCYGSYYVPYTAYAYAPYYVPVDQAVDSLVLASGSDSATVYDSASGSPSSYYGSLLAQLFLGAQGIADANLNGFIDFTGTAFTNSDIMLNGASLTLNLEPLAPVVSNAPEPATWAMLLIGFAAVGGAVRAKRRRVSRVALA